MQYVPSRNLRSSNTNHLVDMSYNLIRTYGSIRAFSSVTPALWNDLPQNIWSFACLIFLGGLLIYDHPRNIYSSYIFFLVDFLCYSKFIHFINIVNFNA